MEIYFRKNKKDDYLVRPGIIEECRPCAMYNTDSDYAVVDVERIIILCKKSKFDFDLYISDCISHEWIHSILERDVSLKISHEFDYIYHKFKKTKSPFHILGTGL